MGGLLALVLVVVAFVLAPSAGAGRTDNTILNQVQTTDPVGDSTGVDLSSLTLTSYADGTLSLSVQLANRSYLQRGETVQLFIDLDGDGKYDLNLSIWSNFDPSYLDRWNGSDWDDIRQLPELVQTPGTISVRLSLAELRNAAAVPLASRIAVAADSYTADAAGNLGPANDGVPSTTGSVYFSIAAPPQGTATTVAAPTITTSSPKTPKARTKVPDIPVVIVPMAPVTAAIGKDVVLHVGLKSRSGAYRTFKVCAEVRPALGVAHATECRSEQSSGGDIALPFSITYQFHSRGTTHVLVKASAGVATATSTATIHVT